VPRRRRCSAQATSHQVSTVKARLDMGMQVASWARDRPEITSIPWKRLAVEVFHLEATPAVVSRMRRAYRDWRLHSVEGSLSSVGAGASRKTTRRRAVSDAPLRNTKAPCLMFELMTWFVDFCLGWRVRSRRARIAMRHASGRSDPPHFGRFSC